MTPMDNRDSLTAIRSHSGFNREINNSVELLSGKSVALLIGAGCSKCAGLPLTTELTKVLSDERLSSKSKTILKKIQALYSGSVTSNIEDYLSDIVDNIAILARREARKCEGPKSMIKKQNTIKRSCTGAEVEIQNVLARCIEAGGHSCDIHRSFVKALHRTLQQGRGKNCVNYIVLNYDTLVKNIVGYQQVNYTDGFVGGAIGWWSESAYDQPDLQARVFKLHGSIDWIVRGDKTLPQRVRIGNRTPNPDDRVLIWPAATKYAQTQRNPFAQMLGQTRKILRPKHPGSCALAVCGYSFGDAHINAEMSRAMRETDKLFLLVFVDVCDSKSLLVRWLNDPAISAQIRVHHSRGFRHGVNAIESKEELTWWKF